jgi:hypothetical protein
MYLIAGALERLAPWDRAEPEKGSHELAFAGGSDL